MSKTNQHDISFGITIAGYDANKFRVLEFDGEEELSDTL